MYAHERTHFYSDSIDRISQSIPQLYRPPEFVVIIFGVVFGFYRIAGWVFCIHIHEECGRGVSFFQCRRIGDGLECAPRLAQSLRCDVKLKAARIGRGVIFRPDHRQNFSCFRVYHHCCAIGDFKGFCGFYLICHNLLRFLLQLPIKRRRYPQSASFHHFGPELFYELLLDVCHKMRRAQIAAILIKFHRVQLFSCFCFCDCGYISVFAHPAQHLLGTPHMRFRV